MAYIYKITNTINNKAYIGKTEKTNPLNRWKEHIKDANKVYKNKRPLYEAIKKYGSNNFTFEVIEETLDPCNKEIFYISLYDTYKNGYNATIGGDGTSYITNQKEIIEYYLNNKPFLKEMCNHFKLDRKTISKILKNHNIDYDKNARHNKVIIQLDKHKNILNKFKSCREAAKFLGNINLNSKINQCCNNKIKTCHGFIWRFE